MKDRMVTIKNILTGGVFLNDRYIPEYGELSQIIDTLKKSGYKIAMTQGVYDLLHPGHVRYLEEARSFGDILVVALDTDEYTRLRKASANERRPVVPFEERLEILVNLRSVGIVTQRDIDHRDDPYKVIRVVRPDVLVLSKSTKDITAEDYEGLKEICGSLQILEAKAVISTTARLRGLLMDGAGHFADHMVCAIKDYFAKGGREFFLGDKK